MTTFIELPILLQNTFCLWALLICFGGIADTMLLLRQKRFMLCALAALVFISAYFLLHVIREGTELRLKGQGVQLAIHLLNLPFLLFIFWLIVVSIVYICFYVNIEKWKKTHITSASIKESIDLMPAGICYYLDNGMCVLVNHRMNDICFSLMGRFLQDGTSFYESVKDKEIYALSDGTAVSFRHRILNGRGMHLHELIADDITELYKKTEELRLNNEKAGELATKIKAYGEMIEDVVRSQEILQAKVNIHDEMNRMILETKKTAVNDSDEKERCAVLKMWRTQAIMLCRKAGFGKSKNVVSDLNTLASAVGISIVWDGMPVTDSVQTLTLFLSITREAMANALKHADAKKLSISVRENDNTLSAIFTNDGIQPAVPISETGGLRTVRERVEKIGGQMNIDISRGFALIITIPKEDNKDVL